MIEFVKGDILRAPAEALVNTVNSVGFMGRGIALQFKKAYPANNAEYVAACRRGEVEPGRMLVHGTGNLAGPKFIINFPTKRHWRGRSRLEDIDSGLRALVEVIRARRIASIAIPPLGSGLGGLDWRVVRPRIVEALEQVPDVRVLIYEPVGPPEADSIAVGPERPRMTAGRAALVSLMGRYLEAMMDATVSLLEIHKLMYFLQEAGESLRLRFVRGPYGPYGENLRHVLNATEGYLTSGYAEGGDAPDKIIRIVPGALAEAEAFVAQHSDSSGRLGRVVELIQGFESPYGMELLSSVHIVAKDGASSVDEAMAALGGWNERKRRFTKDQVTAAWNRLSDQGWLPSA